MSLSQNEINDLVSEVLPNVKERVKTEIENRLVAETLNKLQAEINSLIKKEFEEILTKEIHAAIEGEKPIIIDELRKSLKEVGKAAGESLLVQANKNLAHSWNVKKLFEGLIL